MSNLFMTMDNSQENLTDVSDVVIKGGQGADGQKWLPILSASTTVTRSVQMVTGKPVLDSGKVYLQPYKITREADKASPVLRSLTYQPGDAGFGVIIVQVRPAQNLTEGFEVTHQINLMGARFTAYEEDLADEAMASETLTIAFQEIREQSWHSETGKAELQTLGPIHYDISSGVPQDILEAK